MKESIMNKVEEQLAIWDEEIAVLESKAEKVTGQMRRTFKNEAAAIRVKQREASDKLKAIDEASQETWASIKAKADKFWIDLKHSISNALSK
jgi:hypothetical protein